MSTEVTLDRQSVQGLTWVFHRSLDDLSVNEQVLLDKATASPDDFNHAMRARGGIDVDVSFIKLIVTGNRQAGVVITGMQAKVEKRGPPLRGALFYAPPEGEQENAQVGFDLDEAIPIARLVEPNKNLGDRGYLGREYFRNNSVELDLGEHKVFSVVAMTMNNYYAWYIEMEVKAGGRTKYIRIDLRKDEEQDPLPFQISARADPREHKKGNFAVYKELYVLDRRTHPVGFIPIDPQTYTP